MISILDDLEWQPPENAAGPTENYSAQIHNLQTVKQSKKLAKMIFSSEQLKSSTPIDAVRFDRILRSGWVADLRSLTPRVG